MASGTSRQGRGLSAKIQVAGPGASHQTVRNGDPRLCYHADLLALQRGLLYPRFVRVITTLHEQVRVLCMNLRSFGWHYRLQRLQCLRQAVFREQLPHFSLERQFMVLHVKGRRNLSRLGGFTGAQQDG